LPDDLVRRGKRNEVRESFERHAVARLNDARDRIVKRDEFSHVPRPSPAWDAQSRPERCGS
jgi:hypothetical protein